MKLAIILVHYHTSALLQPACEALLRDAEAHGLKLEGLVVDNGSRPEDRVTFSSLPFRYLQPGSNLGYAGGANFGIQRSTAEYIVVMNPDVWVLEGCLSALLRELQEGADVAGPRFYWDADRRFLLPPTEAVTRRTELLRVFAQSHGWAAQAGRRWWRQHAHQHWQSEQPLASYDLSGALLAMKRSAWQRVGPFDEGYRLYFEETDWLQRLRQMSGESRYVPAAEAVHLYAQSTVHEGRSAAWFLESSRRFRRKVWGEAFVRGLEWASARVHDSVPLPDTTQPWPEGPHWLEVAATPIGYPAAVSWYSTGGELGLSTEIQQRLSPGTYYLRAVGPKGRELATRVHRVNAPGSLGPV